MDKTISVLQMSAGVITWGVVFVISVLIMRDAAGPFENIMPEAITLQAIYLVLMLVAGNERFCTQRPALGKLFFSAMLAVTMILGWRTPIEFLQIYTIIWIAMAPYFFSRRVCLFLLVAVCASWYVIERFSWEAANALFGTLLFATFHFFALLSAFSTRNANQANERAQELNRELMATQQLLAEASKQNERTRIARDLHDLLGHHLTALTINLQVAGRLSEGEAKERIDQCHGLSKLLLSDVRDAVTTLREESAVDFTETLKLIVQNVPKLKINLDIDSDLSIDDVNVAETLLRCVQEAITNTLRHSNAKESWIRVWRDQDKLRMSIRDDGKAPQHLQPGNGLIGMRERIERLDGKLMIEALQNLTINVQIPLPE